MAGILSSYGYQITTTDPDKADLWILNSCTVKTPSEQTFINLIENGHAKGKKLVLAGCVPQGNRPNRTNKHKLDGLIVSQLSMIGVQQIDQIVYVVEETLKGFAIQVLDTRRTVSGVKSKVPNQGGGASLALPKIRKNPLIEIIPINTGCLNQCTYCKTKHARGELGSYPVQEIVDRVQQVLVEGVVEIWLTSEDTGTYGRDIGTSLPVLLDAIVPHLPANVMLRVGMTNPPYILEHLQAMARILAHPQVYAFLHVPVQAGNDHVLNAMRRQYTVADFRSVVDYLNAHVDGGVNIATDIICGFPTESDLDFLDTVDLVEAYQFPSLHISQFYPRPGTPAARMAQLPRSVIKQRSRQLTQVFESYLPFTQYVGTRHRILVTELASDKHQYVGHTKLYHQVLIPPVEEVMGTMVEVEITSVSKFSMNGRILSVVAPQNDSPVDSGREVPPSTTGSELRARPNAARREGHATIPPHETALVSERGGDGYDPRAAISPQARNFARVLLIVGILCLVVAVASDDLRVGVPALLLCIGAFWVSLQHSSVPLMQYKRQHAMSPE